MPEAICGYDDGPEFWICIQLDRVNVPSDRKAQRKQLTIDSTDQHIGL